jgi:hypothetical protein
VPLPALPWRKCCSRASRVNHGCILTGPDQWCSRQSRRAQNLNSFGHESRQCRASPAVRLQAVDCDVETPELGARICSERGPGPLPLYALRQLCGGRLEGGREALHHCGGAGTCVTAGCHVMHAIGCTAKLCDTDRKLCTYCNCRSRVSQAAPHALRLQLPRSRPPLAGRGWLQQCIGTRVSWVPTDKGRALVATLSSYHSLFRSPWRWSSPDVTFTTRLMRTELPYCLRSASLRRTMLAADQREYRLVSLTCWDVAISNRAKHCTSCCGSQQADHCGTVSTIASSCGAVCDRRGSRAHDCLGLLGCDSTTAGRGPVSTTLLWTWARR